MFAFLVVALIGAAPCHAWLYDGGSPHHLAAVMKDGTSLTSTAAPFVVGQDSYATSFGGALARAYGPAGASVTVSLTTWTTQPDTVIASWSVVPTSGLLEYYYVQPDAPILLQAGVPYSLVFTPQVGFAATISYCLQGYYGYGSPDLGKSWNRLAYPLCARVDGYAVPEPGAMSCLVSGLVGLGFAGAGRRRQRI